MKMRIAHWVFILSVTIGLTFLFHSQASAQSGKLPPFRIVQSNGKVFKAEQLPFEKPIVIIYFSPECEHCTIFIKELFKRAADVKKASVVLITYLPVEKVTKFIKDYKVTEYPNMIAGTEGTTFFIRNYYRIADIPFVALYDKNGNFISFWQKNIPFNDLVNRLKKLN